MKNEKGKIMEINWVIFWATVFLVALQAMASIKEGTFYHHNWGKGLMPFVLHGGMWGDLLILPVVNGLVWQYLNPLMLDWALKKTLFVILVVSFLITWMMHILWSADESLCGHMWPSHRKHDWLDDMSLSGKLHMVFMTLELTLLGSLIFSSDVPKNILVATAVLLTIFWPMGVILPCRVVKGIWLDVTAIVTSLIMMVATWGVCLGKM